MLSSISPVGEASRRQRWWITASAYTVASIAGGALIGATAGALGLLAHSVAPWTPSQGLAILAAIGLVGAASDAKWFGHNTPSWRRQVDERWLDRYRGWVYGVGFGFQLGLAVATIVTSAITYVALAAAALTASVDAGAVVGAVFGLSRAVPLLTASRIRSPGALQRRLRSLDAIRARAGRLTVAAQVLAAVVAVAVVVVR